MDKKWIKLVDKFPPEDKIVWTRKTFVDGKKTSTIVEHMIFHKGKMYTADGKIKMYYLADEWCELN